MLHSLVFIHPSTSIGEELKDVFQVSLAHGDHTEEECSPPIPTTPKTFWGDPGDHRAEQHLLFPQVLLPFTSSVLVTPSPSSHIITEQTDHSSQ